MEPKELNELLLKTFPALKGPFEECVSWQDGLETGSTIVFEDVLMPYFIYCFEESLSEELKNIYEFIEQCVSSNDAYCKNVIEVAIIENIYSYDIRDELSSGLLENSMKSYMKTVDSSNL